MVTRRYCGTRAKYILSIRLGIAIPQIAMRLRRFCKRQAFGVLLTVAVTLLAAQGIAFQHDLDLDTHAPDQVCEVCITAAVLGGANVGQTLVDLQPADTSGLKVAILVLPLGGLQKGHSARGPPTAS